MAPLFIPLDGRMISQNLFTGPFTGAEATWLTAPGTPEGDTYYVLMATMAAFFSAFPALNASIVTSGSSYSVKTTDTRVLIDKTIGSATSVVFPLVNLMQYQQPVLIKDIKGDAATNNITISFSGGQLIDGLSQIVINNNYGWAWINPIPGGSGWYQS